MNEEYIFKLAEPYVQDGLLTYDDFEIIFKDFELHDQYLICEILYDCGVELVDELPVVESSADTPSTDKNPTFSDEPLVVNIKVTQSNEVLCKLIQEGNQQAKQDLCVRNKNLIFKVAHRYALYLGHDLPVEDLIQAGMIGMLEAANRFDPALGHIFSTYALWWIRQSIVREIQEKGFKIRIPVHFFESIIKIIRKDNELYLKGDTSKSSRIEKIADELEISVAKVEEIISIKNKFLNAVSLDTPINEEEDSCLRDFIEDKETPEPADAASFLLLKEQLEEVLSTLTPREMRILRLRFGLDDGRARTLEEIGQSFGVTRERIRQIEVKALRKLRHPSRSKKLADFVKN